MTVLLVQPYGGFPAGAIATFAAETETAIVAQRLGTTNAGPQTAGPINTTNYPSAAIPVLTGFITAAAAATSVVVNNSNITTSTKCDALIQQVTADGTATSIVRSSAVAGQATFYFNAASTGVVVVAYYLYN